MRRREWWIAVILAVLAMVTATGCGARAEDYLAFRDGDFRAEVAGELCGIAFGALIERETGGAEEVRRVTFLSPQTLRGLVVTQTGGALTVEREGLVVGMETGQAEGLLTPLEALFSCHVPASIRKTGGKTEIVFAEDCAITLSENGIPECLSASGLEMRVVWWEEMGEGK